MTEQAISISSKGFKGRKPKKTEKKPPKKITESYLTNSGQFYLDRFPASVGQFRTVMMRKIKKSCAHHAEQDLAACIAMLNTVIEKFERIGFLNDEGYAQGLVRSLQSRGWPKNRIIMRLKMKNISTDIIEPIFEDNPRDEFTNALIWVKRKKFGAYDMRNRTFEKSMAAMARAGFDFDTAKRALALSTEEIEEYFFKVD